jgi:hypothetical protein
VLEVWSSLKAKISEITCSVPKAQIHRGAVDHNVCAEVIEDSGYVILQNAKHKPKGGRKFRNNFRLFITMSFFTENLHIFYSKRYQERFPVSVLAKYIVPRNEEFKTETRRKPHVQANTEIPKISIRIQEKPESLLQEDVAQRDEKKKAHEHYSGELVAGVADEHAGLPHGAVPHRDALDEPGHAGCHSQGPRWKKEISGGMQRTRGEASSLFLCCLVWLWLLVEEGRRKRNREGSHAFSLLSLV